ncbi:hypothetical protein PMAYCL1PPCAC_01460, partial [Pristionchus mayeri]
RAPSRLFMYNTEIDDLSTYTFWQATTLLVSYRAYAVRNSLVALAAHIPVVLLLRCTSLFPHTFARYRSTIVFTTHGLLLFNLPQYILFGCFSLMVWSDVFIPMGVCSILKHFTSYLAQSAYIVVPVVAVVRYLSVVWQFCLDRTPAWLVILLLAVPNV